jgi:tagatose 6-phosphate kinase
MSSAMVLTVTLNPMLDKTVYIDTLRRGAVHRSPRLEMVVGGKGINVARQLKRLGADVMAAGFFGGEIGMILDRLLTDEALPHSFVSVQSMTREGVTYREPDNSWTAVFEPPHHVTALESEELVHRCMAFLDHASWVVCSGSSPCGETDGLYGRIMREAKAKGRESYIDSYGPAFRFALQERPTVVQCNKTEFAASWSTDVSSDSDVRRALVELMACGARYAILTNGPHTMYAADGNSIWKVTPPTVKTVNSTGSGDSLAAGILWQLTGGAAFEDGLRIGAAAGAANAMTWEVANSPPGVIRELAASVQIDRVPFHTSSL